MKRQTKRTTALAGATALLLAPIWALPAQAAPDGSDVVINEFYGRGGSAVPRQVVGRFSLISKLGM
ncbi:MAG: hypothetical protein QMB98_09035, partial [Flaviflexus sp.]|uniref:hypothetical protein n=1 Tax=Flaviflexus sp. TaxID=1969482 RepID=UPI00352ED345